MDDSLFSEGHAFSWPTIKLPKDKPVTVGRSPECHAIMDHTSISDFHATLTLHDGKLRVEDLGSRHGTLVNGHPIRVTILNVDDIVFFGSSPAYRFDGKNLKVDLDAQGMALMLNNVEVIRNGRVLLNKVNAQISSGEFVGVLGPSGGGKSLLLGCLSDTLTPDGGRIVFDDNRDVAKHRKYYRSKLGFVPQEDLIYEHLTVQENLQFAIDLRLPGQTRKEKNARIENALDSVDMLQHRAKRAGVLSGGQKKRVSVAIELLTRPRLLLLDEPTSGLDPGTQFRLMDTLRQLSHRGLTVVCVTHSMDSLHFFDTLLVLGFRDKLSTIVYHDVPGKLLDAFKVHTLPDLFDVLQGGVAVDARKGAQGGPAGRRAGRARRLKPSGTPDRYDTGRLVAQGLTIFKRSAICAYRDHGGSFITVALPVTLAVLIIFTQYRQPDSVFASFFLVVSALWLGMTLSVREIVKERKLFVRDRLAGMSPGSFLFGKGIYFIALSCAQSLLLYGLAKALLLVLSSLGLVNVSGFKSAYPMAGLVVIGLVGLGGVLLGLLVSTVSDSEQMAVGTLPMLLLPQVLLSRIAVCAAKDWDDPTSPFIMLSRLGDAVREGGEGFMGSMRDLFVFVLSLPLFTRSGTAGLDLFSKSVASRTDWLGGAVVETMLLGLLVIVLSIAFAFVFFIFEKRWNIR
jgi:ABC-type multidrug transport system ATPase subunit